MTKPTSIPTRPQLIQALRTLTRTLEADGATAERMAPLLAARGWPTGTIGDGGSRSTDDTSGPEREAIRTSEHGPGRYESAPERLARSYVTLFFLAGGLGQFITDLSASAGTDVDREGDMARTGTNGGWCVGCGRWVTGTPEDRLRGGACEACRKAWERHQAKHPDATRALFMQNRPPHDDTDAPALVDPTTLEGMQALASGAVVVERTVWHQGETTEVEL